MNWTNEQLRAIRTIGQSVMVSAAAGSGKTAVLAERFAYLVCEAPEKCDVDEILVVTFTNAAAAEMRNRIQSTLKQKLAGTDDSRLSRQLILLDRAPISTLHSFCTTLLRQHFHQLGLDPNFRVLDEEETALMQREIARELLEDCYQSDSSGRFQRFVDAYGDNYDQLVMDRVTRLHQLLCSVVDPQHWLDQARSQIVEAATAVPLANSRLGRQLAQLFSDWLDDLHRRWQQLTDNLGSAGLTTYRDYAQRLMAKVRNWRAVFDQGNFDALAAEIKLFKPDRLPTIRGDQPFKQSILSLREEMNGGALANACRFTEQQWREGLQAITDPTEVLIELTQKFGRRLSELKRQIRAVDFSDLERFALQILRASGSSDQLMPSPVARLYQQRFKHVLVDEYQDINDIQDAILRLLSRETNPQMAGNLFCVGDVKQSIYRFRLAQPMRFLDRYRRFKSSSEGQIVDLGVNFRSREPLLNVINQVFERLMSESATEIEYDDSHRLRPGAIYPEEGSTRADSAVELHLLPEPSVSDDEEDSSEAQSDFDRTQREAAFVAGLIGQLLISQHVAEKKPDGSLGIRPIRYGDIAILLRAMKYKSEQFAEALRSAGIPVHSESGAGFFDSTEIRDMLALLRLLDNQQQDVPLAAVLRSPLAAMPEPEDSMARIRLAFSDAVPFHRAVVLYAKTKNDELAAWLRGFFEQLQLWRQMVRRQPLAQVIWHIYESTGYLAFCAGMDDGPQRQANLIDLHERARQFGTFQRQGLARFIEFLHNLAEQQDLGTPPVASQADNAVRVMSIHRAKGLEFPVVIVPDLGKKHNFQDAQGSILVDRDAGLGLAVVDQQRLARYPSLAHFLVQYLIRKQTLAEELRVLYVAMTRARERLILIGTCRQSTLERWRDEWAGHKGRLPDQRVLSAQSMLDWLGPVAAIMENSSPKDCIKVIQHDEKELAKFAKAASQRIKLTEWQKDLANLKPLVPPPPAHAEAAQVIQSLTMTYPHQKFTTVPAAMSVGELTKQDRATEDFPMFFVAGRRDRSGYHRAFVPFQTVLDVPRFLRGQPSPPAAEVGTIVHTVLEHLDFSRPCDREDLAAQLAEMVNRKLLLPNQARVVDLDSLIWLVSCPLGQLLRRNHATLKRELAIYYPQASESSDPLDRVMIRGRVDVLIPDPQGLIIADFKTDDVTEQTVDVRARFYRPQLDSYRQAIEAITGQTVKAAYLAFLTPRIIREVGINNNDQ